MRAAGGLTHVNTVLASIDVNMTHLWYPQMHPPYAKYAFLTPEYLVSFFFLLTFGLAAAPHVVNNVLAARDIKYFKWAPLAAFVIYAVVMYLCKITGFAALSMVHEGLIALPKDVSNPWDYSFIVASEYVFPGFFAPLVAIIVLSAVMSTTDRLMLTIGSYVSWDVYRQFINKDASEKSITLLSRVAILAATILHTMARLVQPAGAARLADMDGHWSDAGLLCNTPICRTLLAQSYPGRRSCVHGCGSGGSIRLQLLCQIYCTHAHASQHVRICAIGRGHDTGQPGDQEAV